MPILLLFSVDNRKMFNGPRKNPSNRDLYRFIAFAICMILLTIVILILGEDPKLLLTVYPLFYG